jgi:osmotically-inducible protein OsmY
MGTDDPFYTEAHIHQHLAENPDTAELGVRVAVHGRGFFLSGDVASDERRRRVVDAVRQLVPDLTVHDELQVTGADAPASREELR